MRIMKRTKAKKNTMKGSTGKKAITRRQSPVRIQEKRALKAGISKMFLRMKKPALILKKSEGKDL